MVRSSCPWKSEFPIFKSEVLTGTPTEVEIPTQMNLINPDFIIQDGCHRTSTLLAPGAACPSGRLGRRTA